MTGRLRAGSLQVPFETVIHSGIEVGAGQGVDMLKYIFSHCPVRFAKNARMYESGLFRSEGGLMPFDATQPTDRAQIILDWRSEKLEIEQMTDVGGDAIDRICTEMKNQIHERWPRPVDGESADSTDFVMDIRMCYSAWNERISTSGESAEGATVTGSFIGNISKCSVLEALGRVLENSGAITRFGKFTSERTVLVGYEGEVTLRQRLVVNEDGDEASYAETSHRAIPRLMPCCHHQMFHLTVSEDLKMEHPYQVASFINTIQERLRGVRCDFPELSKNLLKPKVRRARIKNMWLAVREFSGLVSYVRNAATEQMKNPDIVRKPDLESRSADAKGFPEVLKCGVSPIDLYLCALRYSVPRQVDTTEADKVLECGLHLAVVEAALVKVSSIELLEALMYVIVVRSASVGDSVMVYGDGTTDVNAPPTASVNELTEGVYDSDHVEGTMEIVEWTEMKLKWATGVDGIDDLRDLDVSEVETNDGVGHLAGYTSSARIVRDHRELKGLMVGQCELLSNTVPKHIKFTDVDGVTKSLFRIKANQIGIC